LAFLTTVADDGIPVAVRFCLIVGRYLERKGFVVPESRAAIEAHAGNAHHDEIHGQYVAGFAAGIVGRRAIHGLHAAVRKSFGIETRRGLGVVVVPETDNIFVHYVCTFRPPAVTLPSEFFWIIGGIAARNFDGIAARWVAVTVV